MKCFALVITILSSSCVIAQPLQKIEQLLKNKKIVPLISYIDETQKSNVNYRWETLRSIVGDYQEGIIKIEEYFPSNDAKAERSVNNYRVYLLADKTSIFYYRFMKNDKTVDSLNDKTAYSLLEHFFKETYNDTLNFHDLFLTSIVYGRYCGYAGGKPDYKKQLDVFLQDKNVDLIRKWLKSANAEKQLYALEGYRTLVSRGYSLTDEEKRIISIVKQKKGTVNTCGGCLYSYEQFQNIVSRINKMPIE